MMSRVLHMHRDHRVWWDVQGRRFSVPGLLASEELAESFDKAAILIFRLAPQGMAIAREVALLHHGQMSFFAFNLEISWAN